MCYFASYLGAALLFGVMVIIIKMVWEHYKSLVDPPSTLTTVPHENTIGEI